MENRHNDVPAPEPLLLANLTSPASEEAFATAELVIIPVGAHEQHGPALPVSTDALSATVLATLVGAMLAPRVLVAPTVPWGVSWQHQGFAGTITLRASTLVALLVDQLASLQQHGAKRILIANTHGGNTSAVTVAAEHGKHELGIPLVAPVFAYSLLADAAREVLGAEVIGHAGGDEAATVLAIRPDLVDTSRLEAPVLNEDALRLRDALTAAGGTFPLPFGRLTPTGATGDASGATAQAGSAILSKAASALCEVCEAMMAIDLEAL